MRKKSDQQQKYYFSDKLKRRLAQIAHHPLTIVEAPSGFGKTTAVREYLKEELPRGACEYWYTCLGESTAAAWMGICELFSNVNDKTADDLRNLKMPTMDTLFYMASYLRDIRCQAETYLIIDNYQLVNSDIPRELISVFSMHGNPNLHIVIITQQIRAEHQFSIFNDNIYIIDSSSFFFDKEGTADLFRMEGFQLTDEEIERLYRSTEGWISAIRLQIINYEENGSFDHTADIVDLVETAIWNRLIPEEREFLLSISIMESFTIRQAAIMMEMETLSENIRELLKYNEFIRYVPDQHQYSIHSILRDYLLYRFHYNQPEEYQKAALCKAGYAYASISQYCSAAHFFCQVKDFDSILSLPFTCEYFEHQKDQYEQTFIETLVNECPKEILYKYPFTLIVFGYQMFAHGQWDIYKKICDIVGLTISENSDFTPDKIQRIKGEHILLSSMKDYNDIAKLRESQEAAWEVLKKPSEIVRSTSMWGYTTPSVLDILWREPGKLEDTIRQVEEMFTIYRKLAGGQGAGVRSVLKAEAMLMRGKDDEAEILCHKALYDARNYKQINVCICTELILARIAILRGDVQGYFTAVKNIQSYAKEESGLMILRIIEHCMSLISTILDVKDYIAPWLYDMDTIKKAMHAPVFPIARVLHLRLLLIDKRYNEFYGACEHAMDSSHNSVEGAKYMMPQVYQFIFYALAKRSNGDYLESRQYLKKALDIALPDQIYLPFAQSSGMEEAISELSKQAFEKGDDFTALIELCKRQRKGVEAIRKAILRDKSPLTPREREIAQLAKDRLSAKEIAEQLYISEMTVRATLRNVYSKLDIHSKSELILKEF